MHGISLDSQTRTGKISFSTKTRVRVSILGKRITILQKKCTILSWFFSTILSFKSWVYSKPLTFGLLRALCQLSYCIWVFIKVITCQVKYVCFSGATVPSWRESCPGSTGMRYVAQGYGVRSNWTRVTTPFQLCGTMGPYDTSTSETSSPLAFAMRSWPRRLCFHFYVSKGIAWWKWRRNNGVRGSNSENGAKVCSCVRSFRATTAGWKQRQPNFSVLRMGECHSRWWMRRIGINIKNDEHFFFIQIILGVCINHYSQQETPKHLPVMPQRFSIVKNLL